MQQKWNSLDEGSRLTLNLLSKDIDLRNGEVKQGVIGMKQIFEIYMHTDAFFNSDAPKYLSNIWCKLSCCCCCTRLFL